MTDRTTRLLGGRKNPGSGGLLLPEVFREILAALYENPCSRDVLHKVVKDMLPHKSERVLDRWGSWEAFGDELLDVLSDGGFTVPGGGLWALTDKAVPDKMLTVFRDPEDSSRRIRVTFVPKNSRESAEAVAEAWRRIGEYSRWLDSRAYLSPVLLRARQKAAGISEILTEEMRNPRTDPPPPSGRGPARRDGSPRNSGQADWYRAWMITAGWHTQDGARRAWNEQFPQKMIPNVSESSFRNISRKMAREGQMEMREAVSRENGKSCVYEYRMIPR